MSTAPQTIPRLRLSLSVLLCGSIRPVLVCNGLRASLATVCIRVFSSAPAFITPHSLTLFFSDLLLFHLLSPDFQREFQDCFTMTLVSQILKTCRRNIDVFPLMLKTLNQTSQYNVFLHFPHKFHIFRYVFRVLDWWFTGFYTFGISSKICMNRQIVENDMKMFLHIWCLICFSVGLSNN